ncbi:hypothetical protein D9M72_69110 [compost metagenome]
MYIKPRAGLQVIDPVRKQFMPEKGMEVDDFDLYWARRLRDGDVVRASTSASDSEVSSLATTSEVTATPSKGGK